MSKVLLVLAATLLAGTASASSFIATTDTLGASLANTVEGSSDLTSSIGDDKQVRDARDDAAQYIASHGAHKGAQLEAALLHIRAQTPGLEATDVELAQAILAL